MQSLASETTSHACFCAEVVTIDKSVGDYRATSAFEFDDDDDDLESDDPSTSLNRDIETKQMRISMGPCTFLYDVPETDDLVEICVFMRPFLAVFEQALSHKRLAPTDWKY